MGIHKHLGKSKLKIDFFSISFLYFSLTTVTARRASLGEKTMQAAAEADEPDVMRKAARPASLVEKIMQAADVPKREAGDCGFGKQLACDFGSKAACIECGKRDDEARDEAAQLEKLTA